ncbi:MAG: thiamine phosphate synthase, partial [Planctomycetota bacterium]
MSEPDKPLLADALRLVYIVDAGAARDGDRLDAVLGGGVSCIWLRAPGTTGAELYRLARDLRPRCRAHHAALLVGDRSDVAIAVAADGVQIGHRSPPAKRVRPFFPGWLGVSCHNERELLRAQAAGADFAVLSPVYGVPHKGEPLGVALFAQLRRTVRIPVVALGGIGMDNAAP